MAEVTRCDACGTIAGPGERHGWLGVSKLAVYASWSEDPAPKQFCSVGCMMLYFLQGPGAE